MSDPSIQTGHSPEDFNPDWAVHPGSMIAREIDAAGYSQTALAARTNISAKHLNQLLRGHVPLSADVALALERVLNSPSDLWLRMDATWQASQLRAAARQKLESWTGWLARFPTAPLIDRGVWREKQTAVDRVDALLTFFGVVNPDAFEAVWLQPQANFRRSQKFAIDAYSTAVWLRLVEATAEKIAPSSPPYSETLLRQAVIHFPRLTTLPTEEAVREAKHLLLEAGVVLVVEPEIDGTRICGVSRWSSLGNPIIAMTGRQKYLDVFWFTLLHEIAHVLLHPKRAVFLELDVPGTRRATDDKDSQESAADTFAANALVSPAARSRVKQLRTVAELRALAADVGVGASILAGRYGHETKDWPRFGKLRERLEIAQLVAASSLDRSTLQRSDQGAPD